MLSFKIGITIFTSELAFNKNIPTNDDYINNYCVPIQPVFTEKCLNWYLSNKAKDWGEYEEIWIKYFR